VKNSLSSPKYFLYFIPKQEWLNLEAQNQMLMLSPTNFFLFTIKPSPATLAFRLAVSKGQLF